LKHQLIGSFAQPSHQLPASFAQAANFFIEALKYIQGPDFHYNASFNFSEKVVQK